MQTSTKQGLLDIKVELSTLSITAGNQFSLFVLVTNPFDTPVWVQNIEVSLPSELALARNSKRHNIKEDEIKKAEENQKEEEKKEYRKLMESFEKLEDEIKKYREITKQSFDSFIEKSSTITNTLSNLDRASSYPNLDKMITEVKLINEEIDILKSSHNQFNENVEGIIEKIESSGLAKTQKNVLGEEVVSLKKGLSEMPFEKLIARKDIFRKKLNRIEENQSKTLDSLIKLDESTIQINEILDEYASLFKRFNNNHIESYFENILKQIRKQKSSNIYIKGVEGSIFGVVDDDTSLHLEDVQGSVEIYDQDSYQLKFGEDRRIDLKSSLPEGVAIQPGSTVTYTSVLNVKQSLIFTPTKYKLIFNANYSFERPVENRTMNQYNKTLYTNIVDKEISIRPSVYSVILGASVGGFFGAIVRILQTSPESFQNTDILQIYVIPIFISIILSSVSTIFIARKSDVQSFVSVEDFWGGILIGFLVGYTGTSFFESLTGVNELGNG